MTNFKEVMALSKEFTVLYAEDEENARREYLQIFQNYFKEVVAVEDGQEGLEKYQERDFDLVLTDITMPKLNGLEMLERIREQNPHQRAIIISAHNTSDSFYDAITLNVDGYILKPVDFKQLNELIYKVAQQINNEKVAQEYQAHLQEEVAQKTAELKEMYVTNELTSLPNRNALNDFLAVESKKKKFVGMLIDLDNLESANLVYGYDAGDDLIREFTAFLQKRLESGMQLFHLGSDEFLILSELDVESASVFAQNIQQMIRKEPFSSKNIPITISVAIADKVPLVANCYVAMKELKKKGYNRVEIYENASHSEELQKRVRKYMPLIENAIEKSLFVPYFQPIIDNKTMQIEKYEVLARLLDDEGNVYPAFEFIEVGHLSGLIANVSYQIIPKSFEMAKESGVPISINISEQDLQNDTFVEFLERHRIANGLEASAITLEVLEDFPKIGVERFIAQLNGLKKMGYKIAIDDFGTENASFERLYDMNIDIVKIDGKFVKNVAKNPKDAKILKAMLEFCRGLGVKSICEFVCDKEVYEVTKELGSDYSQGYYFSEPRKRMDFQI